MTQLLIAAHSGDRAAFEDLYRLVYDELRQVARAQLRRRRPGDTLQTTALVHEAYLKLCDHARLGVQDRAHFFALSARAMRQILVDHFRRRRAEKRGGAHRPLTLQDGQIPAEARGEVLLALDEALTRLAALDERLAQVVEYKFFGGMTQEEIGQVLGLTERTVRSDWRKARLWLTRELNGTP
ncbi:MAG: sigma-70 family RNA polymerase sigma factor [Rhodothermales bacterium]|nr:sigma-70 family RNA polymerase sigma factor [Rhodothermales bacterium]